MRAPARRDSFGGIRPFLAAYARFWQCEWRGDLRRFATPFDAHIEWIHARIAEAYADEARDTIAELQWRDEEGDWITLKTDSCLLEAIRLYASRRANLKSSHVAGRRCVRMLTPPLLVLRVREQRSSSAVATASPASKSEAAHDEPHPKDPMPAAQVWAARPYYETSGTAGALTRTLRSAVLLWLSPLPHPAPRGFERTHCRLGQGAHPDEVAAEPPLRLTELYWQRRWPSGPGMGYRAAWDTAPFDSCRFR